MPKEMRIIDAADAPVVKRKSPAQVILESVGNEYKTMREVAQMMGVHTETLRRLCRATDDEGNQKVKAPSKAVQSGGMRIYLFTEDDVNEIRKYFTKKGYVIDQ